MTSTNSSLTTKRSGAGPKPSKPFMRRRSPGPRRDPTNRAPPRSLAKLAWHNNMSMSNNSGRSANPLCERALLSILYANAWNGFYRNSSCLWLCLEYPPITIWPSAVFVLWSLRAKSVVAHVAPRDHRRVWGWLLSSAPGWPNTSIPSSSVSLS